MHPVVFVLPTPWGEIPFYAYGLALGAGLVAAWYLARASARRLGEDPDVMAAPFAAAALAAIVLGGLGGWLRATIVGVPAPTGFHGEAFSGPFALAGALASAALLAHRRGLPVVRVLDALAPCLALAYVADAAGHYLHGTEFGVLLPDGAPGLLESLGTFPRWVLPGDRLGAPAYVHHLAHYADRMPADAAASLPVHPTQLYDAALGALVAAVAFASTRSGRLLSRLAPAVAASLALAHLLVDRVRERPAEPAWLGIDLSAFLLVAVVAASALALVRRARATHGEPTA